MALARWKRNVPTYLRMQLGEAHLACAAAAGAISVSFTQPTKQSLSEFFGFSPILEKYLRLDPRKFYMHFWTRYSPS